MARSRKTLHIIRALEDAGHTSVSVRWGVHGGPHEVHSCPNGCYWFTSDQAPHEQRLADTSDGSVAMIRAGFCST
jgi:hypothetical protein